MTPETVAVGATVMQWLTLITLIVGLAAILVKFGNNNGKQEEKNESFTVDIKKNTDDIEDNKKTSDEKFDKISSDISDIKTGVSFIKGQLVGTELIKN